MRAMVWLALLLAMGWAVPGACAASELEKLRVRCAEQARQIRRLEETNQQLRAAKSEATPATVRAKGNVAKESSYTVSSGDTLAGIVRKSGCSVEKLAQVNGLELSAIIRPGQKLKLPAATDPEPPPHAVSDSGAPAANPGSNKKRQLPTGVTELAATPPGVSDATKPGNRAAEAAQPVVTKKPSSSVATPAVAAPKTPMTAVAESAVPAPVPVSKPNKKNHAVTIEGEMTYGEFAAKHGTNIKRLNDLNGLDLTAATVLAKGSELYVPGQP